ncbi:MAG: putative collagen-binding domain-containing protein, partial [Planctomycetota bacterium]
MWDKWDLAHPQHCPTFERHDLYTFCDISQNNHQKGQAHHDNAQKQRRRIADHIRPLNNVKIYGADGGRFGDTRDGIERFWRNIFGGLASARFHRPDSGIGLSKLAQRQIASAREVTGAIDLFTCAPFTDLLGDRKPNEAYCLGAPGTEYAVYFPVGGDVTLNTKGAISKELSIRWFDIDKGRWHKPQAVATVDFHVQRLTAPGKGQWAAVVKGGER